MGSSSSKKNALKGVCPGCGGYRKLAFLDKVDDDTYACQRCSAFCDPIDAKTPPPPEDADEKVEVEEKLARIHFLHILPFAESLPIDASSGLSEEDLQESFIEPHFKGADFSPTRFFCGMRFRISDSEWKVVGCSPPIGLVTADTVVRCVGKHLTRTTEIVKVHILPTDISYRASETKQMFEEHIRPYFAGQNRHVAYDETIMMNGLQMKVIACDPPDGIITSRTKIYTTGRPLRDLSRIHVLPIFESLPNRDKDLTPEERMEKYLTPHFRSLRPYVNNADTMVIDGVDWKIVFSEPQFGVVSNITTIIADGEPLKADDVHQQQLEADEELARRLQSEEAGGMMPGPIGFMPAAPNRELITALRSMPGDDRQRRAVQLAMMPLLVPSLDQSFLQLMRQAHAQEQKGCSTRDIDSLPTREYTRPKLTTDVDSEYLKCMVCLSEYEDGEVIRTLPCFHSYHRECIDGWLRKSTKCPICKHPIV